MDNTYQNLVTKIPLVPEEAVEAFFGENPNGTWALSIFDDTALDSGNLDS